MGCCCHHSTDLGPIETLKSEHRVIEGVLDAAEHMLDHDRIERDFFVGMIDFVRHFADGCHHAKEEDQLFPMMEQVGVMRDGGPIGVMLYEHDLGRMLIRQIEAGIQPTSAGGFTDAAQVKNAARQYIELLRAHIAKEDEVLFVMADKILDGASKAHLGKAFDEVETTLENVGKHERYLKLADALRHRAFGSACAAAV